VLRYLLKTAKFFIISGLLVGFNALAMCDTGGWYTNMGPKGSKFNALVIDISNPSILYAGGDGFGGYKSINGGDNWIWMRRYPTGGADFQDLVMDPSNPKILYAATAAAGVIKSYDGGATWIMRSAGLSDLYVLALAVDANAPSILYAGTRSGGMFKTINSGDSWFPINNGFPVGSVVFKVAIHPQNSSIVFAGTAEKGLFRSTDSGASWVAKNNGLAQAYLRSIYSIAFSGSGEVAYVGGWGHGVFKSYDNGDIWTPANSGISSMNINDIEVTPSGAIIAGGVDLTNSKLMLASSNNQGNSWVDIGQSLNTPEINRIAIHPRNDSCYYVASKFGLIYCTQDAGTSWRVKDKGLLASLWDLAIDKNNNVYAGSDGGGIFKRINNNGPWMPINNGLSHFFVFSLAIDPSNPDIIYAAETIAGGVYKTTNGGSSWEEKNIGLTRLDIYSIAIDPNNFSHICAGSFGVVFQSWDAGENWAPVGGGLPATNYVWDIGIDASSKVYCVIPGEGPFKLSGSNWVAIRAGLPNLVTYKIAVSQRKSGLLFTGGSSGGLYKSLDGGLTWAKTSYPATNVGSLDISPQSDSWVVAGAGWTIYLSKDEGLTWEKINHGKSFRTALDLRFNPNDEKQILSGIHAGGVRFYYPSGNFKSFHFITGLGIGGRSWVGVRDSDCTYRKGFSAFPTMLPPAVKVAAADINGDGGDEIVTGQGVGGDSYAAIYNQAGNQIRFFKTYSSVNNMSGEINLSAGDSNGDGIDEIIAGTGINGVNFVAFYSPNGVYLHGFRPWSFSINPGGEVNVTTGDVDGDGQEEVVCGQGEGGSSWVSVFEMDGKHIKSFQPYNSSNNPTGEVHVGVVDIDGDGRSEILAGQGQGGISWVGIWNIEGKFLYGFRGFASGENQGGEVYATGADLDRDGCGEILVSSGRNGNNFVRIFSGLGGFLQQFQPANSSNNPTGEVNLALALLYGY
jgi:photosystem II stability/assembly factor-like uncharacterized protein